MRPEQFRREASSARNGTDDQPTAGIPSAPDTSAGPAEQWGPRGIVPRAFHSARKLYLQGRITDALAELDALFPENVRDMGPVLRFGRTSLRDAALLKAWCLIEQKKHTRCLQWLESARQSGFLPSDDLGAEVIELNIQLAHERYEAVQGTVESLLENTTDRTGLEYAELRLILGASLRWQGRLDDAAGHVEFASAAFTFLAEPGREAVAANFLGWTYLSMGRLEESRRWFGKSLAINSKLEATIRMAQNHQNLAIVCYKHGDYASALEHLDQELALVPDQPDMICRARIAQGNTERLRGEYLAARSALLEAYSLSAETGLSREEALALEFLGDVFRDEGNPAEARRYYQRGLTVARALAPRGDLVMELVRREGECLDLEGRHEEAHHVLGDALTLCKEVGDHFETAVTRRCLGVNAANLGRWKTAVEHLNFALAALRELSARHEAMIAGFHLSRILVRQIDTGNAGARSGVLLDQAWQQALLAQQLNSDLGTTLLTEEIGELIGDLARRRLIDGPAVLQRHSFSARKAPATRVIAVSRAMQQVLRQCDGFARYDTAVLITGESGTGKKLLARRIHENSPRGESPFVRVSCTATAVDVLARELFGQAGPGRGGPDGTPGLVAQAEGGTLLLENISDLPSELQTKVANLLQEGCYRPLGDGRQRSCNVRIMATSDRDLSRLVAQEKFRPDLLFRLRLMSVVVQPLRERTEDIMPLLEFFLARLEGSSLTARSVFDFQALEAITAHHWPGGAAELESIAHQAWLNRDLGRPVVLRRSSGPAGPMLEFHEGAVQAKARAAAAGADADTEEAPKPGVNGHPSGMTWTSLNSLIDMAGGNKARVARNLGISRITLYRWLKQLDPKD